MHEAMRLETTENSTSEPSTLSTDKSRKKKTYYDLN